MTRQGALSTSLSGTVSMPKIAAAALLLGTMLWAIWATQSLLKLQNRRIVTIALNQLVNDFILVESRRTSTSETAAARTRVYLRVLDRAVAQLEAENRIVLVRESVLGRSIPDETDRIRRAVEAELARAR